VLWGSAGILNVSTGELVVSAGYTDFDDLWDPLATPDGPSGSSFKDSMLDDAKRSGSRCERIRLPRGRLLPRRSRLVRRWLRVGHS
jgi:hypothetical protein